MNVGMVGVEREDGGVGARKASSLITAPLGGSCGGGGAVVSSKVGGGEGAGGKGVSGAGWLPPASRSWNLKPFSLRQAASRQKGHQGEVGEGRQEEEQWL